MAIIEFENVSFTYDGKRKALEKVTLDVEQGAFVCVLGGNGSGKSTLAKHVNALLVPDEGNVRVCGADSRNSDNLFFIRSNAGMVFQNPDDQIVASVIEDDVAFGPENLGVPTEELRERVTDALARVGLQGFEKKETFALSGGQKQRVAIAGVLAMHPKILVLDEASAMLDPRGRSGLSRACRELNAVGLTIVMITHFMEEAAQADRVVVLEHGSVALDGPPAEVLTQVERLDSLSLDIPFATRTSIELRERGAAIPVCITAGELARSLQGLRPEIRQRVEDEMRTGAFKADGESASRAHSGADAVLEFVDVSFTYLPASSSAKARNTFSAPETPADWGSDPTEYWALRNLSFRVEKGEFFGIAGHTGSGKSTLIQLANGLLQPTEGTVWANGSDLSDKDAAVEARRDIGLVFQYPEHQLFAATVFDDVAFGPRNLGLSDDEVEQRVREAIELVDLDLDEVRETSPFTLSGGQQRRVAFAGVLAMRPAVLILDEPAAGLDPQGRRSFMELIEGLHDAGITVVLVSHDMNDLARLCDRVLVLNRGEAFALGYPAEVLADEEHLRDVGLGVPDMVHLANLMAAEQCADQTPAGRPVSRGDEGDEGPATDAPAADRTPAGRPVSREDEGDEGPATDAPAGESVG